MNHRTTVAPTIRSAHKTTSRTLCLAVLISIACGVLACSSEPETVDLVVLHTNDIHARFLEINGRGGRCRPDQAQAGECYGGAARRATAVESERLAASSTGQTVLLLDAGDQFQGTLFYGKYRGLAAATVMNTLSYDAMVVGNHEFDDGPQTLGQFAEAIDFPLLGTNVDASNEPALADQLASSTILERDGKRIGVVGFITEETPQLSSPGPTLVFNTIEDALRIAVDALEQDGVDTIIALSHSGYQRDRAVARTVAGIDIIVGGHTNTLLLNDDETAAGPYPTIETGPTGDPVAVVTSYAWGKYLGRLEATLVDGKLTEWSGEPILLDSSVAESPAMVDLIAPMAAEVEEFSAEVIGESSVDLDGREQTCRFNECNLGTMIANALLEHGRPQGVEIALQNGGGIRSSLSQGTITIGQFLEVMPFGNTASTFKLKGSDLIETLEHGVSRADDPDNDGTGRFLQVAGLRYAYTPNQAPGQRLEEIKLVNADGSEEEIDVDREYSILFNAFNRNGGDGFAILAERAIDAYDQGQVISDVMIDYIKRNSPLAPTVDGRIRVLP